MDVWLNGAFVSLDTAHVSLFDAGLQHGVGLFETMRASGGRVIHLEEHLQLLAESARALSLTQRLHTEPLADAVRMTLERSRLDDARIRVTVTGGDLNLLSRAKQASAGTGGAKGLHDPTIGIVAQPASLYPPELIESGIAVTVADDRISAVDSMQGHKTLNYWGRLRALQDAAHQGCSEALWLSTTGHVVGGSTSNAILVRDGTLIAPVARGESDDEKSPIRPGTVRSFILSWAAGLGIPVERRAVGGGELVQADELVLTNSSWGVMPVVKIESHQVGSGRPGALAAAMIEAWHKELAGIGLRLGD
ncbi:MAG: aminotransferase class IV [Planctomycetota bacterium]|nr:aminotransferase class IV [Planctomycetota bacterium]